jgi:restriction endonuclease Mrr
MAEITTGQLKVLEKLIGDGEFRKSFFEDQDAALAKAGVKLSAEELAALKKIDQAAIEGFLSDVEERLSKGYIISPTQVASAVVSALSEFIIV